VISLNCDVPNKIFVACSGGVDSMVALDFFRNGKKDVTAVYFDHGTPHGANAKSFVESYCDKLQIPLLIKKISREKKKSESPEEFWRNERIGYLNSLPGPVVTGHHLDDAVEWWIFSSLNGLSKLIPSQSKNVIRPFLTTPKKELLSWAKRKNVPFIKDPTNDNVRYARNRIRHKVLPEVLKINPGIHTVVKKKLKSTL